MAASFGLGLKREGGFMFQGEDRVAMQAILDVFLPFLMNPSLPCLQNLYFSFK